MAANQAHSEPFTGKARSYSLTRQPASLAPADATGYFSVIISALVRIGALLGAVPS